LSTGDKVNFIHRTGSGSNFSFSSRIGVLNSICENTVSIVHRKKLIVVEKSSITSLYGFNGLTIQLIGVCNCESLKGESK
jgi:hypothetical protein